MNRFKMALILLVVMVTVFSGYSLADSKVLHMYTTLDPNEVKIYLESFRQETKINVQFVKFSAGEVATKLRAEAKKPQASVWFGGPSIDFIYASKAGLLAPYKSPTGSYLKGEQRDPKFFWSGFSFGAVGFASNTDYFEKNGLQYPTSWQDLLKPHFKNKISLAYPYTSGTIYTVLATLVQMMGEDEAFRYWKELDKNVYKYNTSGSACVTQVGLGEAAVGISFSHDILTKGTGKGYSVKMTFPKEGTGYEIGGVALIKNAPEQKEAKKFIDWVLSKRAQQLLKIWYRIPLHPEAEVVSGAVKAKEIKLIKDFDETWAGENRVRLNNKWRQIIGK